MRTLPLVGRFKEYFAEVKAAQELNKQVCGNCYNYEYDGFVFVDELGERMKPDYLTSHIRSHSVARHGTISPSSSYFTSVSYTGFKLLTAESIDAA